VIAVRLAMLLLAALSILAALGALSVFGQPSLLRFEVAAVVAVLAPLFWPGLGATPVRTVLRVLGWSFAAAAMAAIAIAALSRPAPSWLPIAVVAAMLVVILILAHAAVVLLESRWRERSHDADGARELAGRTIAAALMLLGTLPFWLGPAAEVVSARHPRAIDFIVGVSPVTHLAVASGNDLLRNPWVYQHSNLASLRVDYPEPAALAWGYGSAGVALVLVALAITARATRRPAPEPALK
jgi:hypothetical protein